MIVSKRNTFRILVVEDNPGDYALVEDYLTEKISVAEIVRAQSFDEACVLLSNPAGIYDVIILDLSLPDKSGRELVTEMLNVSLDCPMIILTGFADIQFSIESIGLGVSDYLLKDDLNPTVLYKSIVYCMERRRRILRSPGVRKAV